MQEVGFLLSRERNSSKEMLITYWPVILLCRVSKVLFAFVRPIVGPCGRFFKFAEPLQLYA